MLMLIHNQASSCSPLNSSLNTNIFEYNKANDLKTQGQIEAIQNLANNPFNLYYSVPKPLIQQKYLSQFLVTSHSKCTQSLLK